MVAGGWGGVGGDGGDDSCCRWAVPGQAGAADSWAVARPGWSCGAPLVAAAAIAEPVLPLLLLLQAEKLEGMLKKKGQSIDKVRRCGMLLCMYASGAVVTGRIPVPPSLSSPVPLFRCPGAELCGARPAAGRPHHRPLGAPRLGTLLPRCGGGVFGALAATSALPAHGRFEKPAAHVVTSLLSVCTHVLSCIAP